MLVIDPKVYSLIKVSETGSYTRAAEQLSLTQPAVSQHIRALDGELGIRIFERVNNELRITHEGETAIKYAKRMLSLYNNLQRDLTSEKRQLTQLTVGITHTAESNAISEALAKYVNNHEGVTVKIITDTLSNLYDKVKNYELDFAIVEGKLNYPSLRYLMLDTDCLVLAVSPNHRLAKQSMVTISALKKEKMILRLPDSSTRNLFVSSLESQNMSIDDFNVIMEIDNIATIKDLIRRDFGVSVLAKSACMDELKVETEVFTFADSNDIQAVVTAAIEGVDAMYIPTDNTAASNMTIISNICAPAGIPIICGEEGMCGAGGLATVSISYYDIGYVCGEMAYDVLVNGADISAMPIGYAASPEKKYNADYAEAIGFEMPEGYVAIETE